MVHGQLLAQASLTLVQRRDPPADRGYVLATDRFINSMNAVLIC
jgi:hypothetical protein